MDKVVGDHSEPHPALHSRVSFIETAPQSVSSLENADAPLTAGPPFLSLLEPALPLFPLPLGALRAVRVLSLRYRSVCRRCLCAASSDCVCPAAPARGFLPVGAGGCGRPRTL